MTGALTLIALITALAAAGWAGLFALAEQAPGMAEGLIQPGPLARGAFPLHRALHVSRLALLILAGVAASESVGWWYRPALQGWSLGLVAGAFLYMVADALPRAIGTLAPDAAAAAAGVAQRTLLPFRPLLGLIAAAERVTQALFPPSSEGGTAMAPAQRDMLLGVFSLGDMAVADVMTPRLDIAAVEVHSEWAEVIALLRQSEHVRVPVYTETLDNITGILHAKDLVPFVGGLKPEPDQWQHLARPVDFVPESKSLVAQLRVFQRGPSHVAFVVDEFGGTSGLMTLEDILEEIVGEIHDERHADEKPAIEHEGDRRFWVDGGVTLDELSAALGRVFEREEVSTVGGLIYSELGRVPSAGEELVIGEFRVVVEQVVRRRVRRVYFERLEPARGQPVPEEVE
ncbi:MAG: HlyC/CorC family transporter [Gemmatimonadetes bacterium]|nr:HlyC/CorC family transporter [Gemmatimonadota bacterium]